jgi:general secretion pathway protein G
MFMNTTAPRRRGGFTLIEVLLVLVILVILGSLAMTAYGPIQKKAKTDAAAAQLGLLKTGLQLFKLRHQQYPPELQYLWLDAGSMGADWGGPYVDQPVEFDPWQRPWHYESQGNACRMSSDGNDGQPNTDDDVQLTLSDDS